MSTTMDKPAALLAAKNESFAKFLEEPMTALAMSMIPPADNPDVLRTLLRDAFEAGHVNGAGTILGDFIGLMFTEKAKRTL